MDKITYDLLPKQKNRKHSHKFVIDIYPCAYELHKELEKKGVIERIQEIPQLGVIRAPKKYKKSRYDYVMLQLYLHQLIKSNLQEYLEKSYNNKVAANEFGETYTYANSQMKVSIADIIQILTIVYNIGHFYNTFTASRAVTLLAVEKKNVYDMVVKASGSERYRDAAKVILDSRNYHRLHLLNSILILERCDQTKPSVSLALEILYSYINESMLPDDSKLRYIFNVFRKVRTVSYLTYDLEIAETPLTIDLCNQKAMLVLLKELLSEYNDNRSSNYLIESITKLLDDTVYNENSNAICYYQISRKMASRLAKEAIETKCDYYTDWFENKNSNLNCTYAQRRDYVERQILKLTFTREQRKLSETLLVELEKINNTRVGYYDRNSGEQTILVSIKKRCEATVKRYVAFRVMKCVIRILRRILDISSTDARFLLCTKFFLFYLFDENPVVIKPTIHREKCVICTRGKNSRIREIYTLLQNSIGSEDNNHEVNFLMSQLKDDTTNDTSITIPASILVYNKNAPRTPLCEFDGMIVYPMRKENQIIFLEAKNKDKRPNEGKRCLKDKFDKLSLIYTDEEIKIVDCDAYWKYTL